jgi:hypothetical protein
MARFATGTGPQPITQGDGMVDEATDMAAFGGRGKAVDVMDMGAVLFGSLGGAPGARGAAGPALGRVRPAARREKVV